MLSFAFRKGEVNADCRMQFGGIVTLPCIALDRWIVMVDCSLCLFCNGYSADGNGNVAIYDRRQFTFDDVSYGRAGFHCIFLSRNTVCVHPVSNGIGVDSVLRIFVHLKCYRK